jgi:activator of HSP90 ATPase
MLTSMTRPIVQTAKFSAPGDELYDVYINPKRHGAFTGGPVKISARAGSPFAAFGGMLSGSMVMAIPGQLIVQRWRSMHFKKSDPDSILILSFSNEGKRGRIDMVHIGVPKQDYAGVTKGWRKYYWGPMGKYLKGK